MVKLTIKQKKQLKDLLSKSFWIAVGIVLAIILTPIVCNKKTQPVVSVKQLEKEVAVAENIYQKKYDSTQVIIESKEAVIKNLSYTIEQGKKNQNKKLVEIKEVLVPLAETVSDTVYMPIQQKIDEYAEIVETKERAYDSTIVELKSIVSLKDTQLVAQSILVDTLKSKFNQANFNTIALQKNFVKQKRKYQAKLWVWRVAAAGLGYLYIKKL